MYTLCFFGIWSNGNNLLVFSRLGANYVLKTSSFIDVCCISDKVATTYFSDGSFLIESIWLLNGSIEKDQDAKLSSLYHIKKPKACNYKKNLTKVFANCISKTKMSHFVSCYRKIAIRWFLVQGSGTRRAIVQPAELLISQNHIKVEQMKTN